MIEDAARRYLSATRISQPIRNALATRAVSGRVLSVHGSAINLVFDRRWVTVAQHSQGGLPMGIAVAGPEPLDRLGIRPGMQAEANAARLVIRGRLDISLMRAANWSPLLPSFGPRSAAGRWQRTLEALEMAAPLAPRIGFGPLLRSLNGAHPDRKSTRLNSSHIQKSRMPSSA